MSDSKLKELIEVCREIKNHKKLAKFFALGIIVIIETIFRPLLTDALSPHPLTFFGFSGFLILQHKNYFKKEVDQ